MHNLKLVEDVSVSIQKIGSSIFDGTAPRVLHHYTNNVEEIVNTRSLWATCLIGQDDESELDHGIQWMEKAVERILQRGVPGFTRDVLNLLVPTMRSRKEWMFIACFCINPRSKHFWKKDKKYCLTFAEPRNWNRPSLKSSVLNAATWYQPVIYDYRRQKGAMEEGVQAIVDAISKHTHGSFQGAKTNWMAFACARNAAQLLLGLAVGFKDKAYKDEEEWRLVCCPNLALNNSAPSIADEDFDVAIRQAPRRHVELQIHTPLELFQPLLRPPVPFERVRQSPRHTDPAARVKIDAVLAENHRPDIICEPGRIKRFWFF